MIKPLKDKDKKKFLQYRPIVFKIAAKIKRRLPPFVERSDLISYGFLGLIDAINKYDKSRGTKFGSYAYKRITGAIYDGLREMDWRPRNLKKRDKYQNPLYLEDLPKYSIGLQQTKTRGQDLSELEIIDSQYDWEETENRILLRQDMIRALLLVRASVRFIIIYHYYAGLETKEIADALGVTQSRVCQYLMEGRKKLKPILESYGYR